MERRRGICLLGEEERRGGLEEVGRMGGGEEVREVKLRGGEERRRRGEE